MAKHTTSEVEDEGQMWPVKPTSAHAQPRKLRDIPQTEKYHGLISKYSVGQQNPPSGGLFRTQEEMLDDLNNRYLSQVDGRLLRERRGHQPTLGVQYSLNKKNRWEMGDRIKANLESLNEVEGVQVSLVLGERRPTFHSSDTHVSEYHTVEGGEPVNRYAKGLASNYASLLAKERPQKRRGRRGQRPNSDAGQDVDNAPDANEDLHIRYEIIQGSKSKNLYNLFREKQTKSSHPTLTSRRRGDMIDELDICDQSIDYYDQSISEEDEDEYYSAPETGDFEVGTLPSNYSTGSLLDFVALPTETNYNRKAERKALKEALRLSIGDQHSQEHKKSNIVYIGTHTTPSPSVSGMTRPNFPQTTTPTVAPIKFSQKHYFKLVPTLVRIPKDELVSESLVEKYGTAYLECALVQRRFFIDISEVTKKKLEAVYGDQFTEMPNFSALCIFEVMKTTNTQSDESVPVKIYLNADLCDDVRSLACNTLQPDSEVSVADVLEAAVKSFELLPLDSYRPTKEDLAPLSAKPAKINPLLPELKTYTDQQAMEAIMTVDSHIKHLQRQLTVVRDFEEAEPLDPLDFIEDFEQLCGICFTAVDTPLSCVEITANVATASGGASLMALAQCQHWFCQDCWTIHISTSIQNGQIPVKCSEYDCTSLLDFDSLRSVVALPLCRVYAAQMRDTFIQKHGAEWKWCPNKFCGRVVHVEEGALEPSSVLACYCGHVWCPDCNELPHWPATCRQAAEYFHKLTINGHANLTFMGSKFGERCTNVHVKHCPKCRLPFQKGYGCLHITCRCGTQFCWACLGMWVGGPTHDNCGNNANAEMWEDAGPGKAPIGDHYERVELVDVVKGKSKSMREEWYVRCVAHRYARNTAKFRGLRKQLDACLSSYKQCCLFLGIEVPKPDPALKSALDRDQMTLVHQAKRRLWNSLDHAHQFVEYSLVWFYYTPQLSKFQKRKVLGCVERIKLLVQIVEQDIMGNKLSRLPGNLDRLDDLTMDLIDCIKGIKRVVIDKDLSSDEMDQSEEGREQGADSDRIDAHGQSTSSAS